jgi:hypothetical protein
MAGRSSGSRHRRVVVSYIASRTGQQVKRAALGAEGFVLDHLSRRRSTTTCAPWPNR